MVLGHYMRENRLPRELPRRKAPYDTGKQDDAAQQCEAKCLRTKVEKDNASIRNDEWSASLVKSVKRRLNLTLDAPSGNHYGLQVEPRAVPLQLQDSARNAVFVSRGWYELFFLSQLAYINRSRLQENLKVLQCFPVNFLIFC